MPRPAAGTVRDLPSFLAGPARRYWAALGLEPWATTGSRTWGKRRSRRLSAELLEDRRLMAGMTFDSVIVASSGDTGGVYTSSTTVDPAGNIYMGGYFRGVADFDLAATHPGNADVLVARGYGDGFVAKYDRNHVLQWVRQIGGDSGQSVTDDQVRDIEATASGAVYITGAFSLDADFGGISRSSQGARDAFVAKLDSDGNFLWVNAWGGPQTDRAWDIALGRDEQITAVGFTANTTPSQLYMRQFDKDGNLNWAHEQFSASDSANFGDLHTADDGSIYALGVFKGAIDLDPTAGEFLRTGSTTGDNSFITKLDESGQFQWATTFVAGPDSSVNVQDIALASDGSIVAIGRHQGQVTVDAPSNTAGGIPDAVTPRIFFSRLSSDGQLSQIVSNDWQSSLQMRITSTGENFFVVANGTSSFVIDEETTIGSPTGGPFFAFLELSSNLDVISAMGGNAGYVSFADIVSDDTGNILIPNWRDASGADYDPNPNTTYFERNLPADPSGWSDGAVVKLRPIRPGDSVNLLDGNFEPNEWNEVWTNDSQYDWFTSTQRRTVGVYSVEVDGPANDATLTTINAIDLRNMQSAKLTFDWLIENGFDAGEYLALDVSTNGGASWIHDVRRLNGNVSQENVWHSESVDLTPYKSANLKVRFRAKASDSSEDANVDNVKIIGVADGSNTAAPQTRFYVVNAAATDRTYEYADNGAAIEDYALASGNTEPRGAASTVAGTTVWVADKNRKVYIYNAQGGLEGSWTAGTLTSTATVEGVATDGADVWIVDSQSDKVYRYANAAGRLSGSQAAASSFSLNSANKDPRGIVTDGAHLWVVNNSTIDKVFQYTTSGTLVGSWTIDPANATPTGLTIDPTGGSQDVWIVDSGTDRVYRYADGRAKTSGSLAAADAFYLAVGNANPQGIADPPSPAAGAAQMAAEDRSTLAAPAPVQIAYLPSAPGVIGGGASTTRLSRSVPKALASDTAVNQFWSPPFYDELLATLSQVRNNRSLHPGDRDAALSSLTTADRAHHSANRVEIGGDFAVAADAVLREFVRREL